MQGSIDVVTANKQKESKLIPYSEKSKSNNLDIVEHQTENFCSITATTRSAT